MSALKKATETTIKKQRVPLSNFKEKKVKRILTIAVLLSLIAIGLPEVQAQSRKVIYLQKYTNEPYHFGFLLGLNFMDYSLLLNENYQNRLLPQSYLPKDVPEYGKVTQFQILSAESHTTPGFSVGVIGDKRLGEYFNLRFIPTLSLSSKYVHYITRLYGINDTIIDAARDMVSDDKLATFMEFPLQVKYRSKRYNNIGAYLIAGVNPRLYLASRKNKIDNGGNPALLQTERGDVALELGSGFDIYNQWFKMGIEIKMSFGIIQIQKTDPKSTNFIYNAPLKEVRNKQLQISFTFE